PRTAVVSLFRRRGRQVFERARQPDGELAAHSLAATRRLDGATVHLHQLSGQGQTDAKASLTELASAVDLLEQVEDTLERSFRTADALIAPGTDDGARLPADSETDVRIARAVLRGVVQQVADDLRQARGIDVEAQRLVHAFEPQPLALLCQQRIRELH